MRDKIPYDHTLLIFLVALFVFSSPLTHWWSTLQLPWYSIFVFWGIFIILVVINTRKQGTDDGD